MRSVCQFHSTRCSTCSPPNPLRATGGRAAIPEAMPTCVLRHGGKWKGTTWRCCAPALGGTVTRSIMRPTSQPSSVSDSGKTTAVFLSVSPGRRRPSRCRSPDREAVVTPEESVPITPKDADGRDDVVPSVGVTAVARWAERGQHDPEAGDGTSCSVIEMGSQPDAEEDKGSLPGLLFDPDVLRL